MPCVRCRGLMVAEFLVESANDELEDARAWRCVNCGELVDRQVLRNRHNRTGRHSPLPRLADVNDQPFRRDPSIEHG